MRSSYLELSILRYFSPNAYMLIAPELSPATMADPSLFQQHLLRAVLVTF